jgi:hypothetical protein
MSKREIELAEMALKVSENLTPAIEHLRRTQAVWVFNPNGETICISTDIDYAAQVSMREGIPLELAATALPVPLTIN